MSKTTHIPIRDARDRLIDLLGFGETYPLRDLPVRDEQLTVSFNTPAKIPIDNSQIDVFYHLYDKNDLPVKRSVQGQEVEVKEGGTGETIVLETDRIEEDVTYKILAQKVITSREAYLENRATVKVGLDTSLNAWIRNAQLLDPTIDNISYSEPRIINYDRSIEVEVENSQEGVDYSLVHFPHGKPGESKEVVISKEDVRGNLKNIILKSVPLKEDTDIRVRAVKTFDASENRETQKSLLKIVLPLKVRANRYLQVSTAPSPIIGFKNNTTIKITQTQSSAQYRLFIHKIFDWEFVRTPASDSGVIRVKVDGEPQVQVRQPMKPEIWQEPQGYSPTSDFKKGNNREIQFTLKSLTDDSLVIVQALKEHQTSDSKVIPSSVQLDQAAVILVRPNPAQSLKFKAAIEDNKTSGTLQVLNGQPGVFYYFRTSPEGEEFKLPAYFHKRDESNDQINKGLGQLGLVVDFVVADNPSEGTITETTNRAEIFPEPPTLETGPLETSVTLHVRAVKAQTGIETPVNQTFQIGALP